jgi:hypothetical protein
VNVIQLNRVLFVRTAMKCGRLVGTTLLIYDPDDTTSSISFGVYNYVLPTEDPLEIFPPESYLAVMDPYLRHLRDEAVNPLAMRCDNPQCIVMFADRESWLKAKNICAGNKLFLGVGVTSASTVRALGFCEKGNAMFKKKYFNRAVMFYTAALESTPIGNEELIIRCRSNRANSYLKLEKWAEAADDARVILGLAPAHVKGQYSLALALLCCQRPQEAGRALQGLLDQASSDATNGNDASSLKTALALQSDIDRAILEQTGQFDRATMVREASNGGGGTWISLSRKHMDFWSDAMEVRDVPGKGRGVFVKTERSLPAAALIMVAKADVSSLPTGESTGVVVNKGVNVSTDGNDAESSSVLLYPLAIRHLDLHPEAGPALYALSANPAFDASPLGEGQSRRVDVQRVMATLRSNAFSAHTSEGRRPVNDLLERIRKGGNISTTDEDLKNHLESALWVKPSLLNHSCLSNCSYDNIGDFLFVYTLKPVGPNEELTVPYCDTLNLSFAEVNKKFEDWKGSGEGFACMCARCLGVRNSAVLCSAEQEVSDAHKEIGRRCAALRLSALVAAEQVIPAARRQSLINQMDAMLAAGEVAPGPTLVKLLEMELAISTGKYHSVKAYKLTARISGYIEQLYGRNLEWVKSEIRCAGFVAAIAARGFKPTRGDDAIDSCAVKFTVQLVVDIMSAVRDACGLGNNQDWVSIRLKSKAELSVLISNYVAAGESLQQVLKAV